MDYKPIDQMIVRGNNIVLYESSDGSFQLIVQNYSRLDAYFDADDRESAQNAVIEAAEYISQDYLDKEKIPFSPGKAMLAFILLVIIITIIAYIISS